MELNCVVAIVVPDALDALKRNLVLFTFLTCPLRGYEDFGVPSNLFAED